MLEYCWLFTLLLRSARYFPSVEGKWTLLPPILPPSSLLPQLSLQSHFNNHYHAVPFCMMGIFLVKKDFLFQLLCMCALPFLFRTGPAHAIKYNMPMWKLTFLFCMKIHELIGPGEQCPCVVVSVVSQLLF